MKRAWGTVVIALGFWEALAFLGHAPTITGTIARCHARRRHTTRALVGICLIGLGRHLLAAAA